MDVEFYKVFDNKYTEDTLQEELQKPEKCVTRSETSPVRVLEYKTFTRSSNPNSTYLKSLLEVKSNIKTPKCDQIGNFILNILLPLPMVGSMIKSGRRRMKEDRHLDGFPPPIFSVLERLAGSSAEGLGLPQINHLGMKSFSIEAPDEDTKFVFSELIVGSTKSTRIPFAFIEETGDSPPSFVKLRINESFLDKCKLQTKGTVDLSRVVTRDGLIHRQKFVNLLQSLLKVYIRNENKEMREFTCKEGNLPSIAYSRHGPALSVDIVDKLMNVSHSKDYVLCFPCPKWPEQAKKWITRKRVWPSEGIIKTVVRDGCHVVPKASKQGGHTEFLLSFSLCDRTICQSLNSNQKRCFMLFKFIFKHCLNKVSRGLSSYFCKLTFLWVCEKTPPAEWLESNPLECLVLLLDNFKRYLSDHYLPNYYIPEHNMLADMSDATIRACVRDVERVLINPSQVALDIAERHRFIWLSKDVSLTNILCGISPNTNTSWQLIKDCVLNFLSIMLDKGEVHLVLAIVCEKWACEILPETIEAIKALEHILENGSENVDLVCLKGMLANLYHNLYHEKETEGVYTGLLLDKSLDTYCEILPNVGNHIWIYANYYDLLYACTAYEDLIRHFLTILHPRGSKKEGRLLEGGVYTVITQHNNLTTLEDSFASLSKLYIVPSTVYILYKVSQAYIALSRETTKVRLAYKAEATKVVHYLDKWVRRKSILFPENTDDYMFYLLGKAATDVGDMKIAGFAFQEACSYGTSFACIQFSDDANLNADTETYGGAQAEKHQQRFHPYRRKIMNSKQNDTPPKDMKFIGMHVRVGPFLHN